MVIFFPQTRTHICEIFKISSFARMFMLWAFVMNLSIARIKQFSCFGSVKIRFNSNVPIIASKEETFFCKSGCQCQRQRSKEKVITHTHTCIHLAKQLHEQNHFWFNCFEHKMQQKRGWIPTLLLAIEQYDSRNKVGNTSNKAIDIVSLLLHDKSASFFPALTKRYVTINGFDELNIASCGRYNGTAFHSKSKWLFDDCWNLWKAGRDFQF